jgi:beta-glucanase (GH16 family)
MRIACLFILILSVASCSSSRKAADASDWKLSWSEEFNYTGLPDSTKWSYDVGGDGWGNNELEYYTKGSPNNVEVSNGTLKIKAIRENKENREYTSTRMHTKGKADFTYGKIEIRAKLPAGRGIWPAIWMLGSSVGTVDWPECGEIDIMEHVGFDKDTIVGTVHTKSYNHVKGTQKGNKVFIKDPYNSYHLYSIEWTPEGMAFLLDNARYYYIANEHKTAAEWPFDSPFFLILNVAIGGNWGGQKGIDPLIFPAAMEVDYVRVYTPAKSWAAITDKK